MQYFVRNPGVTELFAAPFGAYIVENATGTSTCADTSLGRLACRISLS